MWKTACVLFFLSSPQKYTKRKMVLILGTLLSVSEKQKTTRCILCLNRSYADIQEANFHLKAQLFFFFNFEAFLNLGARNFTGQRRQGALLPESRDGGCTELSDRLVEYLSFPSLKLFSDFSLS